MGTGPPARALAGLSGYVVMVDGTPIPIDRIRADEPYHAQKHKLHKEHGMNAQAIRAPGGTPLWFSGATPGRTHDVTAARAHGIIHACPTPHILNLADRAHRGDRRHRPRVAGAPSSPYTVNWPSTLRGTTATAPT